MEQIGGTELNNGETAPPGGHTSRRWLAIVAAAALVTLALAGCGGSSGPPVGLRPGMTGPVIVNENSGTGNRSGVTGGALFGGNTSLVREQTALGRRLAIVRVYYRFGESFPTYTDSQIMASGSTLMLSLNTPSGGPTYASIAAGHYDGYLRGFLQAVNQAAIRYHLPAIYFSFEHESSLSIKHMGLGSPAQLVQAWDHIHQLAATMHLNWNDGGRIHWVWIQMYGTFIPENQRLPGWPIFGAPAAYWPGRNEVDIVAADGYSHPGCHGRTGPMTPQSLFGPLLSFAHRNGGLPVFITEWGSTAFPSSQWQTGFIGQMQAFVAANPEIVAVLYWNSRGAGAHCSFRVDTHPASVSALATMAHSAALQGRLG